MSRGSPGRASEVDLDVQGGWQLVVDGGRIEVVHAVAGPGYMPASPGDRWQYATTQAGCEVLVSHDVVVRGAWLGDVWVARVRSEVVGVPGASSERDLTITPAGVSPAIGTMISGTGPVHTRASHGLFLPAVLTVGMRWDWGQELEAATMGITAMTVTGSAEVVAIERVTVPAGTFMAVRVHGQSVSRVHLREPVGAAPLESRQEDVGHWVRGLGLVRHESLGAPESRRVKQLVAHDVRGASR